MIGIYKITSPSERVYIGQSIDITRRFLQYSQSNADGQVLLKYSFNKYGIKNHIFEVIEECLHEELNIRERYWQDYYDVLSKKGLNCVLTETNELPKILSEEVKTKISNAMTGKIKTIETKNKISNSRKNKVHSQETKDKIGLARLGTKYNTKKFCVQKINQFDLDDNFIKTWESYQELIREFPKNTHYNIWECLRNKRKTSFNFKWKFV